MIIVSFSPSKSPDAACDLARWVHLPSGRVYNDTYSAPKVAGHDDVTGEPLSKRPDDNPVSVIGRAEPSTDCNRKHSPSGSKRSMNRLRLCWM